MTYTHRLLSNRMGALPTVNTNEQTNVMSYCRFRISFTGPCQAYTWCHDHSISFDHIQMHLEPDLVIREYSTHFHFPCVLEWSFVEITVKYRSCYGVAYDQSLYHHCSSRIRNLHFLAYCQTKKNHSIRTLMWVFCLQHFIMLPLHSNAFYNFNRTYKVTNE